MYAIPCRDCNSNTYELYEAFRHATQSAEENLHSAKTDTHLTKERSALFPRLRAVSIQSHWCKVILWKHNKLIIKIEHGNSSTVFTKLGTDLYCWPDYRNPPVSYPCDTETIEEHYNARLRRLFLAFLCHVTPHVIKARSTYVDNPSDFQIYLAHVPRQWRRAQFIATEFVVRMVSTFI